MAGWRRARLTALAGGALLAVALGLLGGVPLRPAQEAQVPDGTLVRRVEIQGLDAISEGFVRRIIKTREGQAYSKRQIEDDVRDLLRTRKFLNVFAEPPKLEDNQVVVIFRVQEKPKIASVELQGNKQFKDAELFALTPAAGEVLDLYAVNKGRQDIIQKYKEQGYYYVDVQIDERALQTEGRLIYRINEGPRVRVRKIVFEGRRAFPVLQLKSKIETKTYIWIFRTGAFDEEKADRDALTLQQFYRDEGYLDARVGYRLEFDEVARSDLTVVFVIEEGVRYRIQEVAFEGHTVFDNERLLAAARLDIGRFARSELIEEARRRVQDLYGELGYVDARVESRVDFVEEPGLVRIRFRISEGSPSRFGRITIRGNDRTRDEVVRRELRFYPGEEYNTVKARKAEQRLRETGLFTKTTVTPLADVDGVREALVEIDEADTIQFLIGVGVSTDNGVLGSLSIENRNFDITDWPRTWGQFFRGQSFRGDGQRLKFTAEPGTEVSRFRIDFTEPYLFDLPLRFDTSLYLFQRQRDAYLEKRLGGFVSLSRRFETGLLQDWAIEGALRIEQVNVDDVDPLAASDIRNVRGHNFLTAGKVALVRDTTDSRLLPSEGYRATFSWEQVGALGGDFTFGKPAASFAWYKTVSTDFFDRKSIFALRADTAYVVGDAPVFERFYGGGFGSVRGFAYRGISPRDGIKDNRVGGDFILLTGGEYSVPLYGKIVRGVTFLDMGTVEQNVTIKTWRAAVGFGLRINVDFFGPVPIVLDFGFPISKDDQDNTQVFNFAFGASF